MAAMELDVDDVAFAIFNEGDPMTVEVMNQYCENRGRDEEAIENYFSNLSEAFRKGQIPMKFMNDKLMQWADLKKKCDDKWRVFTQYREFWLKDRKEKGEAMRALAAKGKFLYLELYRPYYYLNKEQLQYYGKYLITQRLFGNASHLEVLVNVLLFMGGSGSTDLFLPACSCCRKER